jgi:putative toxin-antitoxin system antitoxin component (TIGR02293 family)
MIRSPYGVLLLAWTGALAGLFVSERKGDALNLLLLSIPVAVLSIAAAVLAYRSARIVKQVELSLQPKVFDLVRLRAHETESAVLLKALEVFGDSERALQWMGESNPALKNESPIRAVQTEDGRREVLSILGRIQHGVIS